MAQDFGVTPDVIMKWDMETFKIANIGLEYNWAKENYIHFATKEELLSF